MDVFEVFSGCCFVESREVEEGGETGGSGGEEVVNRESEVNGDDV